MPILERVSAARNASAKQLHLCPNCSSYAIAVTWSERVSARRVRNFWSCNACGCEFETSAYISADVTSDQTEPIAFGAPSAPA